ncbi:MAG: mannose-1-phosphate guanylyltransferase [Halieaceae bacterium]|nr:mannose-1-phosphate guanylyltransferase [Halieaceae bacterium]
MKAMILAAGEGRRMRPLTDRTPKPLLTLAGRPLLEHHILNLKSAGFDELIINASYLGEQIAAFCGDGGHWGVSIRVSHEDEPLETAGGIVKALQWLSSDPFLVVNGDVYTDYPFMRLRNHVLQEASAHLVLVDNPPHNLSGDFLLNPESTRIHLPDRHSAAAGSALTFSGVALYHPTFFWGLSEGKWPLKPLFDRAIATETLTGEYFQGFWADVGTPERLESLNHQLVTE